MFVNLGDKYAGSSGGGGASLSSTLGGGKRTLRAAGGGIDYESSIPAKSLMGLPWRYAIGCIDQLDLILRAEIVWSKPNGLPESVTDRVRRSHEQWFHMVKSPRYYAAVDEVREQYAPGTAERYAQGYKPTKANAAGIASQGFARSVAAGDGGPGSVNPLGKLPGSVWTIPSEPLKVPDWLGVDHFAAFPQELPRRLILGWSPPGICTACGEGRRPVVEKEYRELHRQDRKRGFTDMTGSTGGSLAGGKDLSVGENVATITGYACACPDTSAPTRPAVVLDPFGGTGTVAMVARALGRYPVHIDLSADYLRLARWRIYSSGHAEKSRARTDKERQGVLL